MMTRSALQAATREQGAMGRDLKAEIDDLAASGEIPPAMKAWAHELRNGGNLAAHPTAGDRVTKDDAEELLLLVESIFEYLYVVPKHVERRRARRAPTP